MNLRASIIATLCIAAVSAPLVAQAGEVHNREIRQEQRIYQGVQNGSLTRGEYSRLQSGESRINNQRREDLENGDGHLTGQQARQLNREENRLSKRIYIDKHNNIKPQ